MMRTCNSNGPNKPCPGHITALEYDIRYRIEFQVDIYPHSVRARTCVLCARSNKRLQRIHRRLPLRHLDDSALHASHFVPFGRLARIHCVTDFAFAADQSELNERDNMPHIKEADCLNPTECRWFIISVALLAASRFPGRRCLPD